MEMLCWQCWNRVHGKNYAEKKFYFAEGLDNCRLCGLLTEPIEVAPPSGWRRIRKWFWDRRMGWERYCFLVSKRGFRRKKWKT